LADTAQNSVTYEELMQAAGYIKAPDIMSKDDNGNLYIVEAMSPPLNKRDLQGIEKDLEKMMEEIKTNPNDGIAAYGGEIDDDDLELLENAFRTALKVVKKINKEKYTPKKFKE